MKINKIGKISLAVLAAGVFGLGSITSAKEINSNGWPLPNKTNLLDESIVDSLKDFNGRVFRGQFKIDRHRLAEEGYFCYTYSAKGKPFCYIISNGPTENYYLIDRDGDGTFESKYDLKKDIEELYKEGTIPDWVGNLR